MNFKNLGYGIFEINGVEYSCADEFICTNIDEPCLKESQFDCCGCGECLREQGLI